MGGLLRIFGVKNFKAPIARWSAREKFPTYKNKKLSKLSHNYLRLFINFINMIYTQLEITLRLKLKSYSYE